MAKHFYPAGEFPDTEKTLEWVLRLRREGKLSLPYRMGVEKVKGEQPSLYVEDNLKVPPGMTEEPRVGEAMDRRGDGPIPNFSLVEDAGTWALYRCGQPDAEGFEELRRLGINAILKMNTDEEFSDADEARLFAPGILSLHPLTTYFPDPDYARRGVAMIQALADEGRRIAVHCTHGRDRTGFVIAAWRILVSGWTAERADRERRLFGPALSDEEVLDCLREIGGVTPEGGRIGFLRAAYRLADGSVIVTGFRHEVSALPARLRSSGSGYEDGFVDQDGTFLTRTEAAGRPRQPPTAEVEISEESAELTEDDLRQLGLSPDFLSKRKA